MKNTPFIYLLLPVLFIVFAEHSHAQITLHASDYGTITGTTDSIKYADPTTVPA